MSTLSFGWQQMPDGKEKYSAYLCSREWSLLKEAVRRRSGGKCERCAVNEMDHVHHLTYQRKYRESLQDLQACCKECHEFIHGKSDHDPARCRPVLFCVKGEDGRVIARQKVRSFYLAGKITGDDWRGEIVEDWSFQNGSRNNYEAFRDYEEDGNQWGAVGCASESVPGVFLDYTGPWWFDGDPSGGHGSSGWCASPHAYGLREDDWGDDTARMRPRKAMEREVSLNVRMALDGSDLVFAWINSADCFGTLAELGFAAGLLKTIVVAIDERMRGSNELSELWLALSFAQEILFAESAGSAWKKLWSNREIAQ